MSPMFIHICWVCSLFQAHFLTSNIYLQKLLVFMDNIYSFWGFPHSSVGKESACNAGDHGSIPGLGRAAGEGIGYPL